MDIRDLRYFNAAAELEQFRGAAERVGRSQPALTKCIQRLEAELDAKLFERVGRNVRLTTAGQALLLHSHRIVQAVREATREVTEVAQGRAGHVRIGTSPTTAELLLPGLIIRMLQEAPGATFEITTGLGTSLRQGLQEARLDVVIGPLFDHDAALFDAHAIVEDTMVVAGRVGHPLGLKRLRLQDLAGWRWLLPREAVASAQWLRRSLDERGMGLPEVQVQTDTVLLLRRVVARSDLLTFISRRDLGGQEGAALQELAIPTLRLARRLGVLSLAGRYIPPAASRLLQLLRDDAESLLNG